MRFVISHEVPTLYPELRIGVLLGSGMTNGPDSPGLRSEAEEAVVSFRARFDLGSLLADDRIKTWRSVYATMGFDPDQQRPTVQGTLQRVLEGKPLPAISRAVTAYLITEVQWLLPVGGYDIAYVVGDITLRISPGDEPFLGIGESKPKKTKAGEIVYSDARRVLTRIWNYRDADATKLRDDTRDAVLMIEAPTHAVPTELLVQALAGLEARMSRECGGKYRALVLDVANGTEVLLDKVS